MMAILCISMVVALNRVSYFNIVYRADGDSISIAKSHSLNKKGFINKMDTCSSKHYFKLVQISPIMDQKTRMLLLIYSHMQNRINILKYKNTYMFYA